MNAKRTNHLCKAIINLNNPLWTINFQLSINFLHHSVSKKSCLIIYGCFFLQGYLIDFSSKNASLGRAAMRQALAQFFGGGQENGGSEWMPGQSSTKRHYTKWTSKEGGCSDIKGSSMPAFALQRKG